MGQIVTFAFEHKKHYLLHMTKSPVERRLMNKAVDYLGRYATSQHRLREVLYRFALRKLDKYDPDEIAAAIGATVTRCQTLGYVDDGVFAQSQARSQRRLGRSKLSIRQRLRQHKLDDCKYRLRLISAAARRPEQCLELWILGQGILAVLASRQEQRRRAILHLLQTGCCPQTQQLQAERGRLHVSLILCSIE